MNKPWTEQQALVTGGASGIGLAIAKKLHRLGVKLLLCDCDSKKLEAARALVSERCRIVCVDVTDLTAVESAFGKHIQETGAIDILVNSAGITNVKSHEVPPTDVDLVFRVNFFGRFNTSRAVIPGMLKQITGAFCTSHPSPERKATRA
jgi:3-oxoacyl-[acyl-carrier protein] reductase